MDTDRTILISSDGHATARMADWRPYLPASLHEEFDAFIKVYAEHGTRNFEVRALQLRLDPEEVERWSHGMIESGRIDGNSDPYRRLKELDQEGVAAEVLFPDFGLPFELVGGATATGVHRAGGRDPIHVVEGSKAFNRWLADFCAVAPQRWAGMASIPLYDVADALAEIRAAHRAGLKGIVLPHFDELAPVYDQRFDPVWSLVVELDLVVNCHSAMSSVTTRRPQIAEGGPAECAFALLGPQVLFNSQQLLTQMIWGGVFDRHPSMRVVFTEMGSGWVISALRNMDYTYEGSYLRRDVRAVVKRKPSEIFEQQCSIGSSVFSRAEMQARHQIGVNQIMLGMDFPHHEGTFAGGTTDYIRATLGAAAVPRDESQAMLTENALATFNFDRAALSKIAERIGTSLELLLTPPTEDNFPRGDVNKPLVMG